MGDSSKEGIPVEDGGVQACPPPQLYTPKDPANHRYGNVFRQQKEWNICSAEEEVKGLKFKISFGTSATVYFSFSALFFLCILLV
jgi:hypothetical protein